MNITQGMSWDHYCHSEYFITAVEILCFDEGEGAINSVKPLWGSLPYLLIKFFRQACLKMIECQEENLIWYHFKHFAKTVSKLFQSDCWFLWSCNKASLAFGLVQGQGVSCHQVEIFSFISLFFCPSTETGQIKCFLLCPVHHSGVFINFSLSLGLQVSVSCTKESFLPLVFIESSELFSAQFPGPLGKPRGTCSQELW